MTSNEDLFKRDDLGRTCLFHAAATGDLARVREIIFSLAGTGISCQRLALINTRDATGKTAADVASEMGHEEIANLLAGEAGRMEYFE